MNKISLSIILLFTATSLVAQNPETSIYDFKIKLITGDSIVLGSFKGKKILIVNIASGSEKVSQYAELKALSQHKDTGLVIICFPSDDFNNEKKNDEQLRDFFSGTNSRFLLTKKNTVTGNNISPLYEWLTKRDKNGVGDIPVKGDFQKFLISKDGKLIGYFSRIVSPIVIERMLN